MIVCSRPADGLRYLHSNSNGQALVILFLYYIVLDYAIESTPNYIIAGNFIMVFNIVWLLIDCVPLSYILVHIARRIFLITTVRFRIPNCLIHKSPAAIADPGTNGSPRGRSWRMPSCFPLIDRQLGRMTSHPG